MARDEMLDRAEMEKLRRYPPNRVRLQPSQASARAEPDNSETR